MKELKKIFLNKNFWLSLFIICFLFFIPLIFVGAVQDTQGLVDPLTGAKGSSAISIEDIVSRLAIFILSLIGIFSLVVFILSGVRLIIFPGNEEQLKKAKDAMFWSVIGILISLSAYSILTNVFNVLQGE